ncbi:MAG: hybrid sensor histidine kinase/response regulator [Myxococcota bacterium]
MSSGLGAVLTYALLTVLWGAILLVYLRQRRAARSDALITLLLSVLSLDAFKTFVESAYFGLVWGANYGLLPPLFKVLGEAVFLTSVKWLNVGVAVVVLLALVRRWLPTELALRATQRENEEKLKRELEESLRAARESEARFLLASSASRDFVWDEDLRTQRVFVSPRFIELLGHSADDWAPSREDWLGVVHPDDRPALRAAVNACLEGKTKTFEQRWRAIHKDGRVLHIDSVGACLRDEATGAPTRFAGFFRDVTADLEAEQGRVQAQKLESLGLLAGGVAHDFNNLLTVVSASLSLAEVHAARGQPVAEELSAASLAVKRASVLTRQLLAYAGRGPSQRAPLAVNQLLEGMGELLSLSVPKRVTLARELQPGLPAVMGDDVQLQQVVMNLLTNAAEAIGAGEGRITLRTELVHLAAPPPEARGAVVTGRAVKLTVSDTGAGMTPEVKARLFDPFFSTRAPGRGLGLAAVLGILRAHGGAVTVTSTLGHGSTFEVFLPALADEAPVASPPPLDDSALGVRVLVVDDEALLRRSASRLLLTFGCTVTEAPGGPEAVELVRADPSRFDVVLMDYTMPEMDGAEATRRILALAPSLPVVLSSGYSGPELGPLPPGVRTLPKPWDANHLEALLRELKPR